MDTSDPEIQFDDQGICNHCNNYFYRVANEVHRDDKGLHRIERLVANIRKSGQNNEYDCIIGVSGGVDSTYVAYKVKELGLRPLAVHFDNGWDAELAVDNIKRALDTLKIDLSTYVVNWEEFRDLQVSFLKASVPNCEIPTDHAINALLFNQALQHGVKYIIAGGNVATEGIMPFSWGYYNQDLKHIKAIQKRFGAFRLNTLPQLSLSKYLWCIFARGIKLIPILNSLDYNKPLAIQTLQNRLGWRSYGAKHFESIYTRFFQGYILPTKFGFDKRRAHLSCLICSGDILREQALEEMKQDAYGGYSLPEDRLFVIKKLGLTEEEFDRIMKSPLKSFADYPSNALIFHNLPKLKAIFKRFATRI